MMNYTVIKVGNEWIYNQSYQFIIFNDLKFQNPKQRMNGIGSLSHALKFKSDEDKMKHSLQIQFTTVQNSNERHEGWFRDNSLQLLFWR
jgi:hypothetical protein